MAGGGAKKRAEENKRTLQLIGVYIVVCSAVHAVVRLWLKQSSVAGWHYVAYAATLAAHAIAYLSMVAIARPVVQNSTVVDGGGDLSKGVIQYYFDLVYVTGFVQILAAFTDYGWYVFLLVPGFAAYLLVTKVIMPVIAAAKTEDEPMDDATRKRLERTQQRADRRRVRRI